MLIFNQINQKKNTPVETQVCHKPFTTPFPEPADQTFLDFWYRPNGSKCGWSRKLWVVFFVAELFNSPQYLT
jgi:hypothetical protein